MQFTLDDNVKVLKWALVKTVTKSLDGLMIVNVPFLATPIVRQIMDTLIGLIVSKIANEAEMEVFFQYTDLRVSKQGRDFVSAAEKHQVVMASGTPEQKAKSEDDLFHAFRELAMIKG